MRILSQQEIRQIFAITKASPSRAPHHLVDWPQQEELPPLSAAAVPRGPTAPTPALSDP